MFCNRRFRFLASWGRALCFAALLPLLFPAVSLAAGYCPPASVSYAPAYVSYSSYVPTYTKVVKEYVPVAVKAVEEPDYYYSLKSHYQKQEQQDAASWRAFQLFQQMQQRSNGNGYQQPPQAPQYPPQQPPYQAPPQTYQPPPQQAPPQYEQPPPQAPQYQPQQPPAYHPPHGQHMPRAQASAVKGIIEQSCISCHNGGNKDRCDLSDPAAVPTSLRYESLGRARTGNMPKNHPRLGSDQISALEAWAAESLNARR